MNDTTKHYVMSEHIIFVYDFLLEIVIEKSYLG